MNERWLVTSFTASSLIHLGIIPRAALVMHAKAINPTMVPIELVDVPRVEQPTKKVEIAPPPTPAPKPKPKNITAPKLLSKPVLESSALPPTGNTKEAVKEKPVEQPQPLASLPDNSGAAKAGWNAGSKAAEAEGSAAGAGNLLAKAMSGWWGAAASKAAEAAKETQAWDVALKVT